jgi:aspartate racemase
VQVIAESCSIDLPVADLRSLSDVVRNTEAHRLLVEAARRPFDLSRDLVLRAFLLRLGDREHILLLVTHHIASDGWSNGILWRELGNLYEAFSRGDPDPLPELPIQYADYATWQRQWLQGEALKTQLSYWRNQLDGVPALQLPTDRPRPALQSFRGAKQSLVLPVDLSEGLKNLSRREGVTLFMTLLAAFQTLLHRYTGQDDIVVGSPIAGRIRPEIEGLIGFFVNTLVQRTDLSGNPSFRELLGRVREVVLGAYAHQDLPFEKLVEELQPERNLSGSPLFQVVFALQNVPRQAVELPALMVSPLELEIGTAKFDLYLAMHEWPEGLRAVLEYNSDLFDDATIRRMLGHFKNLIKALVADPDGCVSDFPLLTEAERRQLLAEWNDTKRDYPRDKSVHQLFEDQVELTPDAVALVLPSGSSEHGEDRQLTYRELNRKANQLAHYLRKLGVGPDRIVGVCMDRSLEMVIGLLGVLKAGGGYLPLDPVYPKERLTFMLQDSRVSVLLTQQSLLENLRKTDARVVCLDTDWKKIVHESAENSQSGATADNLAYVIYTSGSTGTPKGIEVLHRGISRLLLGVEYVRLDANQAFLHLAPTSFDASTFEIWGALLHGAKCVLLPGNFVSPSELGEVIHKHGISTLWLTASLYNAVIDQAPEALSGVRQLLIGGEALSVSHVRKGLSLLRETQIINGYGPTEGTTFTCCYPIPRQPDASTTSIPIGRPIANTEVYLLDPRLSPVPIGVAGELYIGGEGLARGYLNRPDLTAEKFIAHPFSSEPGARLYKTGDLARYLPDGNIEFFGRTDHQVKIRGFRIELGEIETLLGQHSAVRETVVMAREDVLGEKRLVAYVVPDQDPHPTTTQLRSFLKEKLPDYMVPSAFMFLDTLPLTPNGKVDRRALPAPDQTKPELQKAFMAPRDTLELQLTKIWEDLLRIKPIGLRDNFFELGGHSLLAVRLLAQIEKITGQHLPLASLFQASTIEEQVNFLRQGGWSAPWESLVAVQPGGSRPPFFCVHAHDGNVLFWRDLAHHLGPDQPFYAFQAQGLDGKQAPHTRIEDMAAHYIKEMRALQPEGPYFVGGHCLGGVVAFEMATQLHAQGQRVALLALFDSFAPRSKKLLRNTLSLRHKLYWFVQLLNLLISDLSLLGPGERLPYIKAKLNKLLYKIYMGIGLPWVGAARARREILKAGTQALRNYNPNVYQGRVTLFRATKLPAGSSGDPQMRWGRLASGGLEIHFIPGLFAHMIYEPRVRVLAQRLEVCLNKAQATEVGQQIGESEQPRGGGHEPGLFSADFQIPPS